MKSWVHRGHPKFFVWENIIWHEDDFFNEIMDRARKRGLSQEGMEQMYDKAIGEARRLTKDEALYLREKYGD